jgi:hypothetical protein
LRGEAVALGLEQLEPCPAHQPLDVALAEAVHVAVFPAELLRQELDPAPAIREVIADEDSAGLQHARDLGQARGLVAAGLAHVFEHADRAHRVEARVRVRQLARLGARPW